MIDRLLAHELLRRGLVSPGALEALQARGAGDPRPLAARLREAGLIDPRALERVEAELEQQLRDTRRAHSARHPPADPARPTAAEPLATSDRLGGSGRLRLSQGQQLRLQPELELVVEGVLGEGGMGVVYLVRDPRLGRQAALKLVKEGGDHKRALRFQRESVVTARLDHPGIPPVYEVGRTPGGQDYLLMRYVAGDSLAARVHAQPDRRREPRELLDALVKVAEALAYAHSRGVVHRDVKPENVLLGAFGEVLLMDWGLARDPSESRDRDASVRAKLATDIPLDEAARDGLTLEGAVLGTAGWMSPEQASGRDVDRRADVFALGALLGFVLTGEPPVAGETGLEVLARTAKGEIVRPRARQPGVARELDAIAVRAMAFDPAARYGDAEAFARDLKAYLEGRPVSAVRYGAAARLLRAVRAHPARAAALVVTLLLGGVAAGAVQAARGAAQAEERVRARRAAEEAWAGLEAPGAADEARLGAALAASQAAQRWRDLAPGDPDAGRQLRRAGLALGEVAAAGQQWALARQAIQHAGDPADPELAAALARVETARQAGAERRRQAVQALLVQAREGELGRRPDGLTDALFRLVAASDEATSPLLAGRLREIAATLRQVEHELLLPLAEPDEEERRRGERELPGLREALEARQAARPGQRLLPAQQAELTAAGRRLEQRTLRGLALAPNQPLQADRLVAGRQARALRPGGLDELRLVVQALGRLPASPEALPALTEYLAVERDTERTLQAGLSLCRLGSPDALALARDLRRAAPAGSRLAVTLGQALAWSDPGALLPGDALSYVERGDQRRARGERAAALEDYQRALDLDPRLALAHAGRGALRLTGGELDGAEADLQRALELEPGLAVAWTDLASLRCQRGLLDAAIQAADRAVEAAPEDPRARATRAWLAWFDAQVERALADARLALELDPEQPLAWAARALARARQGELEGARADAAHACELQPDAAEVWLSAGLVDVQRGDLPGAETAFSRALELAPWNAWAVSQRAAALAMRGDIRGALADMQRVTELTPRDPAAWLNLGRALLQARETVAALRALDQAQALAPDDPDVCLTRAMVLAASGSTGPARAAADRAVELGPQRAQAWSARARVRASAGDLRGAEEDLLRAVALDPEDGENLLLLAGLRMERGDRAGARESAERAVEINPRSPSALGLRAALRLDAGDARGALADAVLATEVNPRDARAWWTRGAARSRLDDLPGALEDLSEATRLAPREAQGWFHRASVLEQMGRTDAARADWQRVLQTATPGSAMERAARGKLGQH